MRRVILVVSMLGIPGLVGVLVYRYRTELPNRLTRARSLVGTHTGTHATEQLVERYPHSGEAHFLRARQLRLEGRVGEACAELLQAQELGWPRKQIEREQLFCAGRVDFPKVRGEFERLLDGSARDRELLFELAVGYEQIGQLDSAVALASRVLTRDPDDGDALLLRGRILHRQRHLESARVDLDRVVQGGADRLPYAAARLLLANCLLDLGRFEEANTLFRACVSDEPNNAVALFGVGRTAVFLDRWDEAQKAMEQALELRPEHPETLLELARIHEWRGELSQALGFLRRAEQFLPNRPDLLTLMAKLLRALGKTDEAAVYSRRYTEQQVRSARRKPDQPGNLDDRDLPNRSRNPLVP